MITSSLPIWQWGQNGDIKSRIERALPLAETRAAQVAIEARETTRKWLLSP